MAILKKLDKYQQTLKKETNHRGMNNRKTLFKNPILLFFKFNNKLIIKIMGYFKHFKKICNLIFSKINILNNKILDNKIKALLRLNTKSMIKILTIRMRKFRKKFHKSHLNNKDIKNKKEKI